LYLAVVMDLFSRKIVGWATSASLQATLVLDALDMALRRRTPGAGLVHHSDRGCQYAAADYQR
jgi:transposase InsO family protein